MNNIQKIIYAVAFSIGGLLHAQTQEGMEKACRKLELIFLFDQSPSLDSNYGYYFPILEELVSELDKNSDTKSIFINPIAFSEDIYTWTGKMEPLKKVKESLNDIKNTDWRSKLKKKQFTKLDAAYNWVNEIFKVRSEDKYQVVFLVSDGDFLNVTMPDSYEPKENLRTGMDYTLSKFTEQQLELSRSRNVWQFFHITEPLADMQQKKVTALQTMASRKPWDKYQFFFSEGYSSLIADLVRLIQCQA